MGVYIKGMEMPDSCDVCKFSDWSNLHQTACCKILEYEPCFRDYSSEYKTRISDLCPLVEVPKPHGRLVDADVLVPDICHDWEGGRIPPDYYSEECIREAPTVIEAEDD